MIKTRMKPPRFALWLLRRLIRHGDSDFIVGDLTEQFQSMTEGQGFLKSKIWFWSEVLHSLPGFLKNTICWRMSMFFNYLKTTLRSMKRQKVYSLINIIGLSIGMACCILILLWVADELGYDRYHEKSNRVYRVYVTGRINDNEIRIAY